MRSQCILSGSVFSKGFFCASRACKVSVWVSESEWELPRCCWLKAVGSSWTNTLSELCLMLHESGGTRSKLRKSCQEAAARSILSRLNLLFCEADLLPNAAPPKPVRVTAFARASLWLYELMFYLESQNSPTNSHQLWIIRCCQAAALKKKCWVMCVCLGGVGGGGWVWGARSEEYQAFQAETND